MIQDQNIHRDRVINSALWAAAGDAVGWITELAKNKDGVAYRTGGVRVDRPVDWKRKIGGRAGVRVDLPAGTYSDDTQLRLAVCRSIRSDGEFDVEVFAKVELPVWPSYSLGAGVGSLAAAANLAKSSVNWFSNHFDTKRQNYTKSGGNGASMRIQPHVWASRGDTSAMIQSVLRDAIVTHGHTHGFCGAVFHALCLRDCLEYGQVPPLSEAHSYIDRLSELPKIVRSDSELSSFWLGQWEASSDAELEEAIYQFQRQAADDLEDLLRLNYDPIRDVYRSGLELLGCLSSKYRGSGFKTALAALFLCNLCADDIQTALLWSAHELDSDTDTIATMAGALLGATTKNAPNWPIQDRNYITEQARRLHKIASGKQVENFVYPDLSTWNPPINKSDAVGVNEGRLALRGLGLLEPFGEEFKASNAFWQWCRLPFGQSVLAKRRSGKLQSIDIDQLPTSKTSNLKDVKLIERLVGKKDREKSPIQTELPLPDKVFEGIDAATSRVIRSGFDDEVTGQAIISCIDATKSIEDVVALAAIIAKARIARG